MTVKEGKAPERREKERKRERKGERKRENEEWEIGGKERVSESEKSPAAKEKVFMYYFV